MGNQKNYSCIEFSGLALHPTFSIYLFEIEKGKEKFFYVGMTGDGHYPSARSILHRLAGHIDLGKKSTQSQFMKGLKDKVFKGKKNLTAEDWETLHIKLHQWPIPGFEPWEGDLKNLKKESAPYQKYKATQTEVLNLEKRLIEALKEKYPEKILNEKRGKANLKSENKYPSIYNDIKDIVGYE
ncbi:hypothetical protein [Algoriphagus sp.]|jgi:hypothetical protein|uniref:hypothetical protein n=1 Tax=Algoriphagus sp. TaxID=1872435 RepID=UPI00272908B2|nr:hypothetical protein [Algoriphagus sp.]MDO8967635.1 hypothetical protein [Algoriphagus sp.]MDP3198564.1 hypothetical protein [Algoriphagus sp.]